MCSTRGGRSSTASRSAATKPVLAPTEWMNRRSSPRTLTIRVWLVASSGSIMQRAGIDAVSVERLGGEPAEDVVADAGADRRRARPAGRGRRPCWRRRRRCSRTSSSTATSSPALGRWSSGGQRWSATTSPAQTTGGSAVDAESKAELAQERPRTRQRGRLGAIPQRRALDDSGESGILGSRGHCRSRPSRPDRRFARASVTTDCRSRRRSRRGRDVPAVSRLVGGALADQLFDLGDGQDLAFDQGLGQAFELVAMFLEQAVGALVGLAEDPGDFLVDDLGGVLGVVAGLAHLAAEERMLLGVAEEDRARPARSCPTG